MLPPGNVFARGGGITMEFEVESSRKVQLMALLMTVLVVGGAIAWAMSGA